MHRLAKYFPAIAIAGWFLYFAHGGLAAALSGDDLSNLYLYTGKPASEMVLDNVRFWSTAYRPLGAIVYVPLYHAFGLHPLAYRIVCFAILGLNLFFLYRLCLRLTNSGEIAFLAAFIGSYHAWFVDLYYSAGTIYDLLCYAFCLGAFLIYASIRARGAPGAGAVTGISLLYILALDAKEMAVTFPVMLLLYEIIFHTADFRRPLLWLRRNSATVWITAILTLIYVRGKLHGPGSLGENPAYALNISPLRYLKTFHLYMNPLFYQDHRFHDSNTVQIVAGMLIVALVVRSRALLFAWFWLLITLLPVAFIGHYAAFFEYLPAVGWTLYLATALVLFRRAVVRLFGGPEKPMLVRGARIALFAGVAVVLAPAQAREAPKTLAHFMSVQPPSREITEDLAHLLPSLRPGARVLFVGDPFDRDFDFLLLATRLFYCDRSVDVERTALQPVPESKYGEYDAVFGFRGNELVLLRR